MENEQKNETVYKTLKTDGRIFHYIDDKIKLLCPYCHARISKESSLCSNCGESIMETDILKPKPVPEPQKLPEPPKIVETTVKIGDVVYNILRTDGRIFHYIDDKTKLLCPHCHARIVKEASLCSNCGESVMNKNGTSEDEDTSESKPLFSFEESSSQQNNKSRKKISVAQVIGIIIVQLIIIYIRACVSSIFK